MRTLLIQCILVALPLVLSACQPKPTPQAIPAPSPNLAGIDPDSPAFLCPADAKLYVQVNHMARWRAARRDDPLVEQVWKSIESVRPPGFWAESARQLGITEDQFADRYFGDCFAVIRRSGRGVVLLSRVKQADLQALVSGTKLVAAPLVGATVPTYASESFSLYLSTFTDDRSDSGWLMIGGRKHEAHFTEMTEFVAQRRASEGTSSRALPEDSDFQSLMQKLPGPQDLLLYTTDGPKTRHVAALELASRRMTAHYLGRVDKSEQVYQQFSQSSGVDFGPLPATTIFAATSNLSKKNDRGMGLLNLLIFPRTMEDDVLPRLEAPMLVFLDQVDGAKLAPDPGFAVPAIGAAVRMKDPAVAADLDRIVGGLHFLTSLQRLDLIGGMIGGRTVQQQGLTYRVTDFGTTLTKALKDPELKRMFQLPDVQAMTRLTHGPIGPWYVVCTQEALFIEWAQAYADENKRLTHSPHFQHFTFEKREGLIMSGLMRAPQFAALMKGVSAYWAKMEARAAGRDEDTAAPADSAGERIRKPMEWIGDAIKRRDSFTVQVWRDPQGDLAGKLTVVEPGK